MLIFAFAMPARLGFFHLAFAHRLGTSGRGMWQVFANREMYSSLR